MTVPSFIRYYFNKNDELAGQISVPNKLLPLIQALFNEPTMEDMYGCYPLNSTKRKFFETHMKVNFDLTQYEYFFEINAG